MNFLFCLVFLVACVRELQGMKNNDSIVRTSKVVASPFNTEMIGVYKLLAIRITSSFGQEPEESLQDIEETIFTNDHSVSQQFSAISHHQLIYEPATSSGVLQVELQKRLSRYDEDENDVINAVEEVLGVSSINDVADRVLFCFPNGSLDDDIAGLAEKPGRRSYYHHGGCANLAVVMHELGHNLRFSHSGIGLDDYEDRSGYMGDSPPKSTVSFASRIFGRRHQPDRRAFNGHKHWVSGWFADQVKELDLRPFREEAFFVHVVCFVDANNTNDIVLLRSDDVYVQFNCAKDYNIDTDVPNTVTFTSASSDAAASDRLAALAEGQSFSYSSEANGLWTFHVCSIGRNDDQVTASMLSIHTAEMGSGCPHVEPDPTSIPSGTIRKVRKEVRDFIEAFLFTTIVLFPLVVFAICFRCFLAQKKQSRWELLIRV